MKLQPHYNLEVRNIISIWIEPPLYIVLSSSVAHHTCYETINECITAIASFPSPRHFRLHERCHRAWDLKSRARANSRKVIISVGEYTCNSQTSEGSESRLLVAFLYSPSMAPVCAIDLPLKESLW